MNYVTAQGSPGSLIRHIQDNPDKALWLLVRVREYLAAQKAMDPLLPVTLARRNEARIALDEAVACFPFDNECKPQGGAALPKAIEQMGAQVEAAWAGKGRPGVE